MSLSDEAVEYFQTYDDSGDALGLVARDQVHAQGLWHCSAHVLLFNDTDKLLLQRRSSDKDLFADCWDYSVGEHLLPGETFEQGMRRGLVEELGVEEVVLVKIDKAQKARWSGSGFVDSSIFQSFAGRAISQVVCNECEVAQVQWLALADIHILIDRQPEIFTPWSLPHLANAQDFLNSLSELEASI
jgi:isopentenyldiphosphate isomerase